MNFFFFIGYSAIAKLSVEHPKAIQDGTREMLAVVVFVLPPSDI